MPLLHFVIAGQMATTEPTIKPYVDRRRESVIEPIHVPSSSNFQPYKLDRPLFRPSPTR